MRHTTPVWFAGLFAVAVAGCAQQTETPIAQTPEQHQTTPTATDQDTATQGSQVYVNVINAPGQASAAPAWEQLASAEGGALPILEQFGGPDASSLHAAHAGYAQAGININVNTGSTTPTVSGATTATATGTQSTDASPHVTPTQDVRPEISASLNAAFAPGGLIDQVAAAVGRGSLEDLSQANQKELRSAALEALESGDMTPLINAINQVFADTQPSGQQNDASTDDTDGHR